MSTSDHVSSPSIGISSRKERKKQAKEERDRLKQVEKKKRRLEKALATATAIRIELEKKKQRRKEEEKRLDEEGAALAEAVALQVLVEEEIKLWDDPDSASSEEAGNAGNSGTFVGKTQGAADAIRPRLCCVPSQVSDSNDRGGSGKVLHATRVSSISNRPTTNMHMEKQAFSSCTVPNNSGNTLAFSTERAKAAELAAGIAAAQAVAALRIAEEARAEAEAAKKAAEAAMSHHRQISTFEPARQVAYHPMNIEMERDELKAQLEKTERQLKEKTRQVAHLEQSLEDMTQYLVHLKAKLPLPSNRMEKEAETSERGSTNLSQSSQGTTDQ